MGGKYGLDLVTFFRRQHAAVHAINVGRQGFPGQRVFGELSHDQMRIRPARRSQVKKARSALR